MVAFGELPGTTQEMVPNLGDLPIDQQRDRLFDIYTSRQLLDPEDDSFFTDNPLADIVKMRYSALTPYVESVKERMRHGPIARIIVDAEISASNLFERLKVIDEQDRSLLLIRRIGRSRLAEALETGSDRDNSSTTQHFGGEYENLTLKEYAIHLVADTTYASRTVPSSDNIKVSPCDAILVYAPEALQEITPKSRYVMGSSGLHVFIDPRLKWQAMLATVETSRGGTNSQSGVGNLALSQLYPHYCGGRGQN